MRLIDEVTYDSTYGATETHEVRADDPQTERQEERDLVAPCKGQIGPAVNLIRRGAQDKGQRE